MLPTLVFDMDGTVADLYGVPDWLGKLRAEDASPYYAAGEMFDLDYLNDLLGIYKACGGAVCVVSWLSKGSPSPAYRDAVRAAKMMWLRENLPAIEDVRVVDHGTCKRGCVRGFAYLFDDEEQNLMEWGHGAVRATPASICRTVERLIRRAA